MKRRLFWKILLGFWFTFFVITQGVWLMFALMRPSPEQFANAHDGGRVLIESAGTALRLGGRPALDALMAKWPPGLRHQLRVRRADHQPGAVVTAPDGAAWRIAYAPRPHHDNHGPLNIPFEVLVVAALGGLAFSAILAWYLTQPIHRLRAGFGRLAQGSLATRLGPAMGRRRDEIADLARDFDQMAGRLEELVAARDRLLADVSHELRTPLARLNLAIGLARQDPAKIDASLTRIGSEARKLDEMVGELLTLAKLESGRGPGSDYFDLAEVVKAVVQDAHYEAAAHGVTVALEMTPPGDDIEWTTLGSGRLMSRAVENILRNALRFSPEGGRVAVSLRADGASYVLAVRDQGPGVSEASLRDLFRPFGASADGFGLGLSIAKRAVAVHGGRIGGRNCAPNGFEMTVTIPAAALESDVAG